MKKTTKLAAAVELGRLGGLKGGKARSEKLSAKRRKEIATNAARVRWTRVRVEQQAKWLESQNEHTKN